jgi:hypothetical protein
MSVRPGKTYDDLLLVQDGGAITSSKAGYVDEAAEIIDLGSGVVDAELVIDVAAIEVDSDDEKYTIAVQISDSATFSSGIYQVAQIQLGSGGTAEGDNLAGDTDMIEGRYILPFNNMIADGVTKRYMRVYCTISGSIVTGINYTAYVARK